jgi:hypothetical protein
MSGIFGRLTMCTKRQPIVIYIQPQLSVAYNAVTGQTFYNGQPLNPPIFNTLPPP